MHISDASFKVFLYMEQLRVDLMNASSLQKHKQNLISSTLDVMNANKELDTLVGMFFGKRPDCKKG